MTPEQRAVLNAAYRVGAALDRKFEASDMTIELRQAAQLYAATYEGDFDFVIQFRDQLAGGPMFFTDGQCKGLLNCLMADAKRRLASRPKAQATAPAARLVLADLPDGRYRVTLADSQWAIGDNLAIKIQAVKSDSNLPQGTRVIATRTGGDEWMSVAAVFPDGFRLFRACQGALRARVQMAVKVLDQAKTQDEWLVAGLAFAQEGSQCFICGRDLDTPESLTAGYGPVCADKHGLPWGAKAIPMSVRLAQATSAPAASQTPVIDPETGVEESADELLALAQATAPSAVKTVSLTEARQRGFPRTYEEIFGED